MTVAQSLWAQISMTTELVQVEPNDSHVGCQLFIPLLFESTKQTKTQVWGN